MVRLVHTLSLALVACLALTACKTAGDDGGRRNRDAVETAAARPAAAPIPWPTGFEPPAVLMATQIVVIGPEGLREHAAIRQDFALHTYEEKTTEEGFVRRTAVRADIDYLAPIRCRLDGLQIFAERELVVLEKPGPVELTIEAIGDVFYQDTTSGREERSARMTLNGDPR